MADLDQLNLGTKQWNKWRREHPDIVPDLSKADLRDKSLSNINFRRVNLEGAKLCQATLDSADLSYANLALADLTEANVCHANLHGTIFKESILHNTQFRHAHMYATQLLDVDMQTARGLEAVYHQGPSIIDAMTLCHLPRPIPQKFLRGVDIAEFLLKAVLEQNKTPCRYFTCFISYASEDHRFAKVLYHSLQQRKVRCWFAPMSLRPGDKFPQQIAEAIQHHDKLLVVLSRHALASGWVEKEVNLAREKEKGHGSRPSVLIPVRLDTAILDKPVWASFLCEKRHIANFEHWKQSPIYQKKLQNLLETLQSDLPG